MASSTLADMLQLIGGQVFKLVKCGESGFVTKCVTKETDKIPSRSKLINRRQEARRKQFTVSQQKTM